MQLESRSTLFFDLGQAHFHVLRVRAASKRCGGIARLGTAPAEGFHTLESIHEDAYVPARRASFWYADLRVPFRIELKTERDLVVGLSENASSQKRRLVHKLTKTGFQDFRSCAKCFWLRHNRADAIAWPRRSASELTRMRDGQQVEALSRDFVELNFGGLAVRQQLTFETETLLARADFVRDHAAGHCDIIEVKASTKVKEGSGRDHISDAAFQVLVAERSGRPVGRVFIVHLNANYRRIGALSVGDLFVAFDVTDDVREKLADLAVEIDEAAALLTSPAIDEEGCDCRFQGASKRCDAFTHFNPAIPEDSAHHLPRITSKKLRSWAQDFGLNAIDVADLSPIQALVHQAYMNGPVMDRRAISTFLETACFPLHFYDYETTGPAVPPVNGYRPYQALPVQFSLHRMSADGGLEHFEWLADRHGQQLELIEQLQACVEVSGSAVSWNKGFENGCNRRLMELYPDKAEFLTSLNDRTIDLEEPFKRDFVHWGFHGSSSIKKVLPVLCPDLRYSENDVHDGMGAVEAWNRMIESHDPGEKDELRRQLIEYCKLDSLAMVRIYQALVKIAEGCISDH